MKRQRGRGRKPGGGGGGGGNHHHNHGNRSLESNGPDVKIRGTAAQIYAKYSQFARDAQSGGDRVKYENYLQHAEHYYRVMAATMPRDRLLQQQNGEGGFQSGQQPMGEGGQQQPSEAALQHGGEQSSDPMRTMDEHQADGDEADDEVEAADAGGMTEAAADGEEESGQDGDQNRNDQEGGGGRGRRRRRRRPHDGERANMGGNNGNGGDAEARSALDSLARKQGALAGG
jgi:Domain of unknown function (DUF4167)